NPYFSPSLEESAVLGTFVGLRPLIRNRSGDPSSLSREFRLFTSPSGLLSVAGGKYTTYRHMAEVITDVVVGRLGLRRRCRTYQFLLDGAPRQPWRSFEAEQAEVLCREYGIENEIARHLLRRYGRHAPEVLSYPAGRVSVVAGEPDLKCEFTYQREHEMAIFAEDHLLRRTRLGLFRG